MLLLRCCRRHPTVYAVTVYCRVVPLAQLVSAISIRLLSRVQKLEQILAFSVRQGFACAN